MSRERCPYYHLSAIVDVLAVVAIVAVVAVVGVGTKRGPPQSGPLSGSPSGPPVFSFCLLFFAFQHFLKDVKPT